MRLRSLVLDWWEILWSKMYKIYGDRKVCIWIILPYGREDWPLNWILSQLVCFQSCVNLPSPKVLRFGFLSIVFWHIFVETKHFLMNEAKCHLSLPGNCFYIVILCWLPLPFVISEISSVGPDPRDRATGCQPHPKRCSSYYNWCHEEDDIRHARLASLKSISNSDWGFMGTSLQIVDIFNDDWVCLNLPCKMDLEFMAMYFLLFIH